MKGLQKLFELTPKIREIVAASTEKEINGKLMKLFTEEITDFDKEYRKAFDAYSVDGFFASPQVNSKHEYHRRFFDWSIVNIVRRTDIEPTNHQLISIDSSVFFIQYLITGGFKAEGIPFCNEALEEEFAEAYKYTLINRLSSDSLFSGEAYALFEIRKLACTGSPGYSFGCSGYSAGSFRGSVLQ
ncbi:MAG: hypothetical protein [Enterobacter phage ENC19]|nr:MAG: hypothetical protein [Enterobacter phage ENC19]